MKRFFPKEADVVCDDYNGRWRVLYGALNKWKSISWTKRGYEKAACESIHRALVFHTEFSGEEAPFSMEDLAARWQAPAAA